MEEILKIFLNANLLDDIQDMICNPDESESSENKLRWAKENKSLSIINTDDEYALVISIKKLKQNNKIKEFCKFVQTLDDDIFVKAVELFTQRFGNKTLQELENLITNNDERALVSINKFKVIVNEIVSKEINKLKMFISHN